MATVEGVLSVWMVLEGAGLARPWASEASCEQAAEVWAAVLRDVTDQRLAELALAWLRSPDSRFREWPTPGALLHAIPDARQVDDADQAWSDARLMEKTFTWARCPAAVAELETLREGLCEAVARAQERRDGPREARMRGYLAALPRVDPQRNEALLLGIRAMGGWRTLALSEDHDLVAHRASFRATYRAHRQRAQITEGERQVEALLGDTARWPAGRVLGES